MDAGNSGRSGRKGMYPAYTTQELRKFLGETWGSPADRAAIREEIAAREAGLSKPFVTPQIR